MSLAHRMWPILLLLSGRAVAQQRARPLYRDATRSPAERAQDLLARMTPEEKFWQLFMIPGDLDDPTHDFSHGIFGLQVASSDTSTAAARVDAVRINVIQRYFVERTRLGIPIIPFEEAVHGLRRPGATMFPQAIALAATWDTALVGRVAAAIARETASRGIRQVLSPVLNLGRDVRWGRVEETYGEDPYLASAMGRAFVGTLERAGVVTTPKHFVANVGEGGRDSYPIDDDERLLTETYYPPFESVIRQAGARSVMTAYNSVDGAPATQNRHLLTEVLKRRWGFPGFVISDAAATGGATVLHMTEPSTAAAAKDAFDAGLDVVFQTSYEQYHPYWDAFRSGMVAASVIDSAVARVLRVKFALGLFEHPYVNADSAAFWNGHAAHRALALEAAREAIVLLRNKRGVLPLGDTRHAIAVIGTDAVEARLGDYSGPGNDPVAILDAIRARVGPERVGYAPGPGRVRSEPPTVPAEALRPGLTGEYFDNIALEGRPLLVRRDERIDFGWTLSSPGSGLARDWYSVRWSGTLTVPAGGARRIGVVGSDGFRFYLDDSLLIDDWQKRSSGPHLVDVALPAGSAHALRLEFFETTGNAHLRLVWDAGVADDWRAQIDSAVRLARRSQVAIIVAGIVEGEFRDRALLGLPGHQEALIREVAATGTPVVVVIVGGSAVTMPWLESVDGVLDVWYPGEAGGQAVAEVLFGAVDPGGRLPITFPIAEGQLPLYYDHKPTGRGDDYVDLTGEPLFPFGYGLSYTSFAYSGLAITPATLRAGDSVLVRCRVKNVGGRTGDEVVQLYLHDELASVPRPVLQLAGFQRLRLAPGEEREVTFQLGPEQLRVLDRALHWVVEPGTFRVLIGGSSKDLRLRGFLTVR